MHTSGIISRKFWETITNETIRAASKSRSNSSLTICSLWIRHLCSSNVIKKYWEMGKVNFSSDFFSSGTNQFLVPLVENLISKILYCSFIAWFISSKTLPVSGTHQKHIFFFSWFSKNRTVHRWSDNYICLSTFLPGLGNKSILNGNLN